MNTFSAYPYAAVAAVVDVDVQTGFVKIVKYCTVHDCGNVINPQIVETQHYGSVVQGLGAAIYEQILYNEEGQLVTSSLMDYKVPTVEEVPEYSSRPSGDTEPVLTSGHQRRGRNRHARAAAGFWRAPSRMPSRSSVWKFATRHTRRKEFLASSVGKPNDATGDRVAPRLLWRTRPRCDWLQRDRWTVNHA